LNQEESKTVANDKWIFDKAVRMLFLFGERILLFAIASLAILAATIEILGFVDTRSVNLADLLLLFIYLEVIGMAAAYYSSHEVPIKLPIFIAITGITRLIILQGKELNPTNLIYEAGSIFLLAASYGLLLWFRSKDP
tara:strand:+ start:348 stop:761 length:414 start_codon:yes stop_codon:yes gene_type:complete